jgi:hypothetical protein
MKFKNILSTKNQNNFNQLSAERSPTIQPTICRKKSNNSTNYLQEKVQQFQPIICRKKSNNFNQLSARKSPTISINYLQEKVQQFQPIICRKKSNNFNQLSAERSPTISINYLQEKVQQFQPIICRKKSKNSIDYLQKKYIQIGSASLRAAGRPPQMSGMGGKATLRRDSNNVSAEPSVGLFFRRTDFDLRCVNINVSFS